MSERKKWSFNRRSFIGGGLAAVAGLAVKPVFGEESEPVAEKGGESSEKKISRGGLKVRGFSNDEMDFQLLRSIGADFYGGAAIGECLYMVSKIKDGDPVSWTKEFSLMAERLEEDGDKRLEKGHEISAKDQFQRASCYYRAAEYYANPLKKERNEYGLKSRDCFIKALNLMNYPGEVIKIPFEDKYMPGYFICPDSSGKKRKTIIVISGFDGTAEEVFFAGGKGALERGYNVMLFDGPGQVGMRRFFPEVPFRPDYEVPLKYAVDYILSKPEVDEEKLAFWGQSFGGYFATRGASFEPRIKALIPDSPIIDFYAYMTAFFNPEVLPEDITLEEIPEIPDKDFSPIDKVMTMSVCMRFGKPSIKTAYKYMNEFESASVIKNIKCPSLALVGDEGEVPLSQAKAFCSGIAGKGTLHVFTEEEGADAHCQLDNLPLACAVVYDWLDELFI